MTHWRASRYPADEYDDDVVSPELGMLVLYALLVSVLAALTAFGAAVFVTTGSFPCLIGALLVGNGLARL